MSVRHLTAVAVAATVVAIQAVGPGVPKALGAAVVDFLPAGMAVTVSQIAAGPDGNLWYTSYYGNAIGRMTINGAVTRFPVPTANSGPIGIALGSDGSVWFTESTAGKIGRITTSGDITEFAIPTGGATPTHIVAAPDGTLWFGTSCWQTSSGWFSEVGRVTLNGTITEFPIRSWDGYCKDVRGLIVGPDGNFWAGLGSGIGRFPTTGGDLSVGADLTVFTGPAEVDDLAVGPDGNIWYADEFFNKIGWITTGGTFGPEYPAGLANGGGPSGMVAGPDGNLWYGYWDAIGAMSPDGTIVSNFHVPSGHDGSVDAVTVGPDGNIWGTTTGYIARVTLSVPVQGVVTAVSPALGPWSGGATVSVTGTGFVAGSTSVSFGGVPGAAVSVSSPTSLTVTVPPEPAPTASKHPVHVTVTTPGGTSKPGATDSAPDVYTYRGVAVVAIRGWTSSMTDSPSAETSWPRNASPDGYVKHLEGGQGLGGASWPDAVFVDFSYQPQAAITDPTPAFGRGYSECETLGPLASDVALLDTEIVNYTATHPDLDIYLVGHSQGGAIAMGYLAYLARAGGAFAPTPDSRLAGIVTLDSPIGGFDAPSASLANLKTQNDCGDGDTADFKDFKAIARNLGTSWPWGGKGSIASRVTGASTSNDALAAAAGAAGVAVMTVGNMQDWSYALSGYHSSQWVSNAEPSRVYARVIDTTESCANKDLTCHANHGAVLEDQWVDAAIELVLRDEAPIDQFGLTVPVSPKAESLSATVPTSGGSVTLPSGYTTLTIASGALSATSTVTVTSADVTPPAGLAAIGLAYQVSGLQMAGTSGVSLVIPYVPPAAPAGSSLTVYQAPGPLASAASRPRSAAAAAASGWSPVPTTVDPDIGLLTATIPGDGTYAPFAWAPSITPPATATRASGFTYTVAFPVTVTGLAPADFSLSGTATGCVLGALTTTDASHYGITVSGCSQGTVVLTLAAGAVADAAGNTSPPDAVAAPTVTIDTTAPVGGGAPNVTVVAGAAVSTRVPVAVSWPAAADALTGPVAYVLQTSANGGLTWTGRPLADATAIATTLSLAPGTYRIRVRATDRAGNAGPWFARTDVVGLAQENAPSVRYAGSFSRVKVAGSSGGYVKYTAAKGRSASYTATGRVFALVSTLAKARGKATVWLDGKRVATIDLYAASTSAGRIVWSKAFAAAGKHTVKIVVTGTKRAAATSTRVDVDAFVVLR